MNDPAFVRYPDAAVSFLLALVWCIIAAHGWRFQLTRKPRNPLFRLTLILATLVPFLLSCEVIDRLVGAHLEGPWFATVYVAGVAGFFTTLALVPHIVRYFAIPPEPPDLRWLAVNYGIACLVAAIYVSPVFFPGLTDDPEPDALVLLRNFYLFAVLALSARYAARKARQGAWKPGLAAAFMRRADVVMIIVVAVTAGSAVLAQVVRGSTAEPSLRIVALHLLVGVPLTLPLAVRILGEVVRKVLLSLVVLGLVAAIYLIGRDAAAATTGEMSWFLDFATIVTLVVVLLPGQMWLRRGMDRLVLRRSVRRRAELQTFLHSLSPESGVLEICRAAVAEVTRVMKLRSAALLLHDGSAVGSEAIIEPLRKVWPTGSRRADLPAYRLRGYGLRELPVDLVEALSESEVVAVVPIGSHRRPWGDLFVSAGFLGATFSDEDLQAIDSFTDQLALTLDGAELLARAISVERSLAHKEKLAALGELSARIAHDIRNPVTAARSLAQQLTREPGSQFTEEHALILQELERIERQITELLRFARRDEFQLETVDLSQVAEAAVSAVRSRLVAAGIEVETGLQPGVVAQVDREKLRHVLLNLIDNAADALQGRDGSKLDVSVFGSNGTASLRVQDNGPGVPADDLGRIFEPFFSRKAHGTGLGLAIAKRTVEAFGGKIAATTPPEGGMTFDIRLPLLKSEEATQMEEAR